MFCSRFLSNGSFGYSNGYMGGGMIFMMVFGFLLFLAFIFVVLKLMKPAAISQFSQPDNSALNILNERFAKGEITEEEYNKIKAMLRK
ncbi:MAG: SHOCT domain-containing protein [Clostridium sp.]|nr:SHOCT domain-containing protein [Clostridium sp.]